MADENGAEEGAGSDAPLTTTGRVVTSESVTFFV